MSEGTDYLKRKIQLPPPVLVKCDREYGWQGLKDEQGNVITAVDGTTHKNESGDGY
jgi:hypothetical protein